MNNDIRYRNRPDYGDNQPWNQEPDEGYRRQDSHDYNQAGNTYNPQNAHGGDDGYRADRYGNTSYGKQYYEERDRRRSEGQNDWYGNDGGRRDYNRSQLGHNYGSGGTSYQNQNYGTSSNQYRSDYAGGGYNPGRPAQDRGQDQDRGWWDRTRDEVASWFGDDDAERRRHVDHRYEGGEHRGKGPRGYQRPVDRIREDVCDRLSDDDRIDASDIQVEVTGQEVVLTGTVHDKAEKRRAEDLVESVYGVTQVENRLRVSQGNDGGRDTWSQGLGL